VERHVTILAILSSLWGALALLLGVSLLLLAGGALALIHAPDAGAVGIAAGLTAGMFGFAGLFALLWGGASLWSGMLLRRHEPLGRALGLALGVVNLLVMPFGTALGIYGLWVLLTNDGRRLFEAPAIS
jgi:hypothetical protein